MRRLGAVAIVLALAASSFGGVPVSADPPATAPADWWITNGEVRDVVRAGTDTYIAGDFDYVGPTTGHFASLDATLGTADETYPTVSGGSGVLAAIGDGLGGWFIGGDFDEVDGQPSTANLVHVHAGGSFDNGFAASPDGAVLGLARSGSTLYVVGAFTSIGGETRAGIAALDAATGAAITAFNAGADGDVHTLALDGTDLYVGGEFTNIGGAARNRIAKLTTSTGSADATWDPNADDTVNVLAVDGSNVYAGGRFANIGGAGRNYVAQLNKTNGTATAWDPSPDNVGSGVTALTLDGTDIYVGGYFFNIGGEARNYLARVSTATGLVDAWDAQLGPQCGGCYTVNSILISGTSVYVGGEFLEVGPMSISRGHLAVFDKTSAALGSWNPSPQDPVNVVGESGGRIFVGGRFDSAGGVRRDRIAVIDSSTGEPTSWNAGDVVGNSVGQLELDGPTLYVAGNFSSIDGAARNDLAALDADDGDVQSWDPDVSGGQIEAIETTATSVVIGGSFDDIDGVYRQGLAEIDKSTADATTWDPYPDQAVYDMEIVGNLVYVGGDFTEFGDPTPVTRDHLAAIDLTTGVPTTWDPNVDNYINDLVVSGNTVYIGGTFQTIGVATRNNIGAVDATSGVATAWDPNADGYVTALALDGSTVYAGGDFDTIGGQSRESAAAIDAAGDATYWNPGFDNDVRSLTVDSLGVVAAGPFNLVGDEDRPNIAAFGPADVKPDAWITRPSDAAPTGDGIYNTSGAGQTLTTNVKRKRSATYVLTFENDGNEVEPFRITGCAASKGFKVSYTLAGSPIDVSGAGFLTAPIPPNNDLDIVVKIQVKRKGPKTKSCMTTASSTIDPTVKDAVIGIVKAKGR